MGCNCKGDKIPTSLPGTWVGKLGFYVKLVIKRFLTLVGLLVLTPIVMLAIICNYIFTGAFAIPLPQTMFNIIKKKVDGEEFSNQNESEPGQDGAHQS